MTANPCDIVFRLKFDTEDHCEFALQSIQYAIEHSEISYFEAIEDGFNWPCLLEPKIQKISPQTLKLTAWVKWRLTDEMVKNFILWAIFRRIKSARISVRFDELVDEQFGTYFWSQKEDVLRLCFVDKTGFAVARDRCPKQPNGIFTKTDYLNQLNVILNTDPESVDFGSLLKGNESWPIFAVFASK